MEFHLAMEQRLRSLTCLREQRLRRGRRQHLRPLEHACQARVPLVPALDERAVHQVVWRVLRRLRRVHAQSRVHGQTRHTLRTHGRPLRRAVLVDAEVAHRRLGGHGAAAADAKEAHAAGALPLALLGGLEVDLRAGEVGGVGALRRQRHVPRLLRARHLLAEAARLQVVLVVVVDDGEHLPLARHRRRPARRRSRRLVAHHPAREVRLEPVRLLRLQRPRQVLQRRRLLLVPALRQRAAVAPPLQLDGLPLASEEGCEGRVGHSGRRGVRQHGEGGDGGGVGQRLRGEPGTPLAAGGVRVVRGRRGEVEAGLARGGAKEALLRLRLVEEPGGRLRLRGGGRGVAEEQRLWRAAEDAGHGCVGRERAEGGEGRCSSGWEGGCLRLHRREGELGLVLLKGLRFGLGLGLGLCLCSRHSCGRSRSRCLLLADLFGLLGIRLRLCRTGLRLCFCLCLCLGTCCLCLVLRLCLCLGLCLCLHHLPLPLLRVLLLLLPLLLLLLRVHVLLLLLLHLPQVLLLLLLPL
eukprot:Rhum_TRINITY_DN14262_c4_g1::Rhum_TRINITY_DN14262_c4_g1_i1::g.73750::m.73750